MTVLLLLSTMCMLFNAGRDVAVSCQPFLVATQTVAEISDAVLDCILSTLPNTIQ
jgi:hypothetical protein